MKQANWLDWRTLKDNPKPVKGWTKYVPNVQKVLSYYE